MVKRKAGRPPLRDGTGVIDAEHEQARVRKFTADKLELEVKRRRSELLLAEGVSSTWNLMLSNFRARVLQLPNKLLPLIQASTSYAEAEQVFKAGVNECLTELADCDPDTIARLDNDYAETQEN